MSAETPRPGGDWSRSELYVMKDLKRLSDSVDELTKQVSAMNAQLSTLEVRSSLFGGLAGAVATALVAAFGWLMRRT